MIDIDGTFDIETNEWDKFILGGLLMAGGHYESFRDEEQMVDALLFRGGTFWTWNGGLFDTLWLAERLRRRGLEFTLNPAGSRIVQLECAGLVVRDAVALVPMSLQKAARMVPMELTKDTGLDCRCGDECGGYCSIRHDMAPHEWRALEAYLRLDCEAQLAVLNTVVAEAERCGYLLSGTVGGSSYKTFSRIAELEPAEWPDAATYRAARAGYYGGRVEVFRPVARQGFAYDINSAYPAALTRVPLPVGARMRVTGDKARRAFARGKEGIYVARIQVPPDMFLPPLPFRTPRDRVIYPTGALVGSWTGLELRGAIERGCVAEIDRALVWSDAEPVLAPALRIGWENRARAKAEGNTTLATLHKWFCNSTTGKLAEAPEKETIRVNPSLEMIVAHECKCISRGRKRSGRSGCYCGAWRPIDKEGKIWGAPFWRISPCAHVHFAAYLTAWTRQTLLAQLEDDDRGGMTAVYCDTDSCYATTRRTENLGDGLGEWALEGEFDDFLALAPKVYRYFRDGWHVRGKGLPGLTIESFRDFAAGRPVPIERGVMPFRSAASRANSLFTRRKQSRRNHADGLHYGGRILRSDGLTYPMDVKEFVRWEREPCPPKSRSASEGRSARPNFASAPA